MQMEKLNQQMTTIKCAVCQEVVDETTRGMYCVEGDAIYNRLKGNTNLHNGIVLMYMAYGETPSHYNS